MKKFIPILCALIFLLPFSVYAGSTVTSGVTAQDIIDRVRYDLNETTASLWSDTELIYWIDEAIWEIVSRTQCLESGASTFVIYADDRDYSIVDTSGTSYMGIIKIEYDFGIGTGNTKSQAQIYDLDRVPFKKLRYGHEKSHKGPPQTFAVNNNTLYIYPIPRSNESGTSLYVYRSLMPQGVNTASDDIETPAYFDPVIWHYVRAKALYKYEKEARGNYYMNLFDMMIKNYIALVMQREIFRNEQ